MSRRIVLVLSLLTLATPAAVLWGQESSVRYDLVLRGGRVMDGTGNPWIRADVAIRDGRIVAVGLVGDAPADRVVDAGGLVVAPGFIDLHSHADDNVGRRRPTIRDDDPKRKAAPNLVAQGITTVVVNQDGRSPWPIADQRRELEAEGVGPNVILLVGHGQVRRRIMGRDVRRPATDDEVRRMRALVRKGMAEGAWGLSAGLEYAPGRWSTTGEVAALVEELVPWDGVYVSHQRSEGSDPMWYWPSRHDPGAPSLLDAVMETIEIGRRSGAKVVASHIKAKGAHYWGSSHAAIQLVQRARDEGVRVWADQYPYATSGSDGSTVLLPPWSWRSDADDVSPLEAFRRTLRDSSREADLRRDIAHEIRRRGGPDRVLVMEYPDSALVGRSIQEVADAWRVTPVDAAIRLQLQGDPERAGGGRFRGFSMSEVDVEAYARQPWVATVTDGGIALPDDGPVHARYYGTFPRKLRRYALDRGVISPEHALRSMTSLPAQILGLRDRGQVREGFRADLAVFDPETIADRADFFDPHQYPEGLEHVLVNGEFVVESGELTWALPGRVLTPAGPGAAVTSVEAGGS